MEGSTRPTGNQYQTGTEAKKIEYRWSIGLDTLTKWSRKHCKGTKIYQGDCNRYTQGREWALAKLTLDTHPKWEGAKSITTPTTFTIQTVILIQDSFFEEGGLLTTSSLINENSFCKLYKIKSSF
jgi:hypothetical protein